MDGARPRTVAVASEGTTVIWKGDSMTQHDPDDPVAQDDFPEFAAPPQQRPAHTSEPEPEPKGDGRQEGVDEVLERLRRERGEGNR